VTTQARIVVLFSVLFAICNSFLQDDAFISLRYARNLIEGHGLVFNPGEYVEGYTNFLWTVILSIPSALNISNFYFILVLGIVLLSISMYFLYKSALLHTKNEKIALVLLILLGGNFSYSSYVTGGLETQLHATLFIALVYFVCKAIQTESKLNYYVMCGILSGLILLNRMDGALIVTIAVSFILYNLYRRETLVSNKSLAVILPILILVTPWLVWKFHFYGSLLPNTFNAKINVDVDKSDIILRGLAYISAFFAIYFSLPFLVYLYNIIKEKTEPLKLGIKIKPLLPLSILLVYLSYYTYVGGDFMEFRFMVPLLPIFLLTIIPFLSVLNKTAIFTLVICYLFSSLIYMSTFTMHKFGLESIHYLESHITAPNNDWKGIGLKLNEIDTNDKLRIAVSPAGAIPYFSRLYTVDMLGLNDKHIAKNGLKYRDTPGHFKMASLEYLDSKSVNIIIGHPIMIKTIELPDFRKKFYSDRRIIKKILPTVASSLDDDEIKIAEIPINDEYSLVSWYLNESDIIEKAASEKRIRIIAI